MFYLTVLVEDKHWMNKMVNFITGGVSAELKLFAWKAKAF